MVLASAVWVWAVLATIGVFVGAAVLGRWLQRKGRDIERNRRD